MNILFIGTSEFSFFNFKKILKCKLHKLVGLITKKNKKIKNPLIKLAKKNNIITFNPKNYSELKKIKKDLIPLNIDIMIMISYGIKIPPEIFKIPKLGCINIHASLLPKWRGSSPIQRSILNGDKITGITFIKINNFIDSGDILHKIYCKISNKDTYTSLSIKLQKLCSIELIKFLNIKSIKKIKPIKQITKNITYAHKIKKEEGKVDWNKKAVYIERQIRAFNIWPKTFFFYKNNRIIICKAKIEKNNKIKYNIGEIIEYTKHGLKISTKFKILNIQKIKFNNSKKMHISEIIKSKPNFFKIKDLI